MKLIGEPEFELNQLVIVQLDGAQHVTEILRRCYDIDQVQWLYSVRGLNGLYPAEIINFKKQRDDRELEQQLPKLPVGQRIRVHSLTEGGSPHDQDATVKGYTDEGEMLIKYDTHKYAFRLPPEWTFDLLPGEPVSHWQVWIVSERDERLLKDDFDSPLAAEYFVKQQDQAYHRAASRHDDWIPPPRFEVRAVAINANSAQSPKPDRPA